MDILEFFFPQNFKAKIYYVPIVPSEYCIDKNIIQKSSIQHKSL